MQQKINCIIIDDEPLAQHGMEGFVKEISFLNLIATCDNAIHALEYLDSNDVELIFLDIKMPKMSGIDFLKNLIHPPVTIITTAYPDYAVTGYELNVLDYIIKPIPFERFVKAVTKAKEYIDMKENSEKGSFRNVEFCFIRCESKYEKLFFEEIIFVEALQNYVLIHTKSRRLITYLTIKSIAEHLPSSLFIQINKSFIISIRKIDNISGNSINIGIHTFSIGRPFKDNVLKQLLNENLVKRL